MSVLTEATRVARKPHVCRLCRRPIAVGTTYRFHTFAGDGTVWSNHEHVRCAEVYYGQMWDGDPYSPVDSDALLDQLADGGEIARCPECGRDVDVYGVAVSAAHLATHDDRRGRECEGSRMTLDDAERIGGDRG